MVEACPVYRTANVQRRTFWGFYSRPRLPYLPPYNLTLKNLRRLLKDNFGIRPASSTSSSGLGLLQNLERDSAPRFEAEMIVHSRVPEV